MRIAVALQILQNKTTENLTGLKVTISLQKKSFLQNFEHTHNLFEPRTIVAAITHYDVTNTFNMMSNSWDKSANADFQYLFGDKIRQTYCTIDMEK